MNPGKLVFAQIMVRLPAVVFPSLVLNYAGQAGVVLAHGATSENIFYFVDDPPGHATRLDAAYANHANIRRGLWAGSLRWRSELAAHAGDDRPYHRIQVDVLYARSIGTPRFWLPHDF